MNEELSLAAEIALTRSDSYWVRHRQTKKFSPDQRPLVARFKTKGKTVRSAQLAETSLCFQIQGGGWFSFCSIYYISEPPNSNGDLKQIQPRPPLLSQQNSSGFYTNTVQWRISRLVSLCRAVARSENPGWHVILDGYNVPHLVEKGNTDLPKSGGHVPPACDRPAM